MVIFLELSPMGESKLYEVKDYLKNRGIDFETDGRSEIIISDDFVSQLSENNLLKTSYA